LDGSGALRVDLGDDVGGGNGHSGRFLLDGRRGVGGRGIGHSSTRLARFVARGGKDAGYFLTDLPQPTSHPWHPHSLPHPNRSAP
jgi:hypothetical protein